MADPAGKDRAYQNLFALHCFEEEDDFMVFPFQYERKDLGKFGYSIAPPGERNTKGQGKCTTSLEEVILKVLFKEHSVRATTEVPGIRRGILKKNGNSYRFSSEKNVIGYWIHPEIAYLAGNARKPRISDKDFERLTGLKVKPLDKNAVKSILAGKGHPEKEKASAGGAPGKSSSKKSQQKVLSTAERRAVWARVVKALAKQEKAVAGDMALLADQQEKLKEFILSDFDGRCPLSGIREKSLLVALPVKPWTAASEAEKTDPENMLILSLTWAALFSAGMVTIDCTGGEVKFSDRIGKVTRIILTSGVTLRLDPALLTPERTKYLKYHQEHVFENWKKSGAK